MKMYRSFLFRSFRITRGRDRLFILLLLLITSLFSLALIAFKKNDPKEVAEMADFIGGCSFILAVLCGMCAGTNNGIYKTDVSTGWNRYIKVLPPTAVQRTIAELLIKLVYVLMFGSITLFYTIFVNERTGICMIHSALNIFMIISALSVLTDAVYSFIIMFAKNKKQLRILGLAAFVFAGFVLRLAGTIEIKTNIGSSLPTSDPLHDSSVYTLSEIIGSNKVTLFAVAAFMIVCGIYFLALWRSHERREP